MPTKKEIRIAAKLATKLAESKERLKRLIELNAPASVIQNEKDLGKKIQEEIKNHPLADELYFQARVREKFYQARKQFIAEKTLLGQLIQALVDFDPSSKRDIVDPNLKKLIDDETVSANLSKVSTRKKKSLSLGDLLQILTVVQLDLEFLSQDIPSAPPRFIIPDSSSPEDE